jgi:hypothetical protein
LADPPKENWATASFCFFSDQAMAKWLYHLCNANKPELADDKNLKKLAAEWWIPISGDD